MRCRKQRDPQLLHVMLQDAKKLQRSGKSLGAGSKAPPRDTRVMLKSGFSVGPSEAPSSPYTASLRCVSLRKHSHLC